jgi:hypothetical protein
LRTELRLRKELWLRIELLQFVQPVLPPLLLARRYLRHVPLPSWLRLLRAELWLREELRLRKELRL